MSRDGGFGPRRAHRQPVAARRRRARAALLGLATALAACAMGPADSLASFHLNKVREVFPGTAAQGHEDAFVELQMYADGENFVAGHTLRVYGAGGSPNPAASFTFAASVPRGTSQSTILIGDGAVAGADGRADLNGALDPAGGAVCWDVSLLDCASWGSFRNVAGLATGNPAAPGGIPDGQAIRRSIDPGCPTLLEPADDSDDSATDFALVPPMPRPNSLTPIETACGATGDRKAPRTKINKGPRGETEARTVTFKFKSSEPYSRFRCRLDRGRYKPCRSPKRLGHLQLGKHTFAVRAIDRAGNADRTPAKRRFTVVG